MKKRVEDLVSDIYAMMESKDADPSVKRRGRDQQVR